MIVPYGLSRASSWAKALTPQTIVDDHSGVVDTDAPTNYRGSQGNRELNWNKRIGRPD